MTESTNHRLFDALEYRIIKDLEDDKKSKKVYTAIKASANNDNDECVDEIFEGTSKEERDRIFSFMEDKMENYESFCRLKREKNIMKTYVDHYAFTEIEIWLCSNFCEEIFDCVNLKRLSLINCEIYQLPHRIAKLQKLEYLCLDDNFLLTPAIPYSLAYCQNLKKIDLKGVFMYTLPAVLMYLKNLEEVNFSACHRTLRFANLPETCQFKPHKSPDLDPIADIFQEHLDFKKPDYFSKQDDLTLFKCATKALVSTRMNIFRCDKIPDTIHKKMLEIIGTLNFCLICGLAQCWSKPGYAILTWRPNYADDNFTSFWHWTCSCECAKKIEKCMAFKPFIIQDDRLHKTRTIFFNSKVKVKVKIKDNVNVKPRKFLSFLKLFK